jgi:hypothetical protein
MSHYKSNVRDIEFNLFELLIVSPAWASPRSMNWMSTRPAASWAKSIASPAKSSPNHSSMLIATHRFTIPKQ